MTRKEKLERIAENLIRNKYSGIGITEDELQKGIYNAVNVLAVADRKIQENGFDELSYLKYFETKMKFILKRHGGKSFSKGALNFDIPEKGDWDREAWANLVFKFGKFASNLIKDAPQIEMHLPNRPDEYSAKDLKKALFFCLSNNTLVTEYCSKIDLSVKEFRETLEILKQVSTSDNIPNISISGSELGDNRYQIIKVPKNHPRNLWFGKELRKLDSNCRCCGAWSNPGSEKFVKAHLTSPDMGLFAVVDKKGNMIGKITVWVSTENALVINAWERLNTKYDHLQHGVMKTLAEKILKNSNFTRVVMGNSESHEVNPPFPESRKLEYPKKGVVSTNDTAYFNGQYEVVSEEQAREIRENKSNNRVF